MILEEIADVLRCQMKRERFYRDGASVKLPGQYICKEMTYADIDPHTGFMEARGELIRAEVGRDSQKYLLQGGDILMTFAGGIDRIGEVGMLAKPVDDLILPSRTLCIIRPKPETDGIWLFYALRDFGLRQRLWKMAKGSGPGRMSVNLGELRKLAVPACEKGEAVAIHEIHENILGCVRRRDDVNDEIKKFSQQSQSVVGLGFAKCDPYAASERK